MVACPACLLHKLGKNVLFEVLVPKVWEGKVGILRVADENGRGMVWYVRVSEEGDWVRWYEVFGAAFAGGFGPLVCLFISFDVHVRWDFPK